MLYACIARGCDIAGFPQIDDIQHAHVHQSMFVPQFECGMHTMLLLAQAHATGNKKKRKRDGWDSKKGSKASAALLRVSAL